MGRRLSALYRSIVYAQALASQPPDQPPLTDRREVASAYYDLRDEIARRRQGSEERTVVGVERKPRISPGAFVRV